MLQKTLVNVRDDADKVSKVLIANSWCPQLCKPVSNNISSVIKSVDPQQCVHSPDNSHCSLIPDLTDTAVDSEGCLDEAGQQSAN